MLIAETCDDTQVLTRLGLTPLQAQVYLTLVKTGKATIKTISSASKIDRANVYRIMPQLQKLNLIEKMLTNPTFYKALPIQDGISLLLEDKAKEYEEIKKKTKELLERQKRENEACIAGDECQFALVPIGKLTYRKIDEMLALTHQSYDILCYWRDLARQMDTIYPKIRGVLEKGVEVRQIFFLQENEQLPEELMSLHKYGVFEIKYTRIPPKSTLTIYDNKQAFLTLFPCGHNTPSLWINNSGIVSIIQDHFELMWKKASDFS